MRIAALVVAAASVPCLALAQARWEEPKTFEATEVLTAAERTGPHHTVDDEVPTKGFYYAFTLHNEFGDLEAVGHALLNKRITETEALVGSSEGAVTSVLTDSRAMVGLSGGWAIALLPLDYLAWTEQVSKATAEIAARAKKELGASGLEMQLTGRASASARKELQKLGWVVKESE